MVVIMITGLNVHAADNGSTGLPALPIDHQPTQPMICLAETHTFANQANMSRGVADKHGIYEM